MDEDRSRSRVGPGAEEGPLAKAASRYSPAIGSLWLTEAGDGSTWPPLDRDTRCTIEAGSTRDVKTVLPYAAQRRYSPRRWCISRGARAPDERRESMEIANRPAAK
ncbi:hypothetical protein KM043_012340 [Ampulex compressa]|nr:hypothetical protein KM043_012340 [Ampulex compressa]